MFNIFVASSKIKWQFLEQKWILYTKSLKDKSPWNCCFHPETLERQIVVLAKAQYDNRDLGPQNGIGWRYSSQNGQKQSIQIPHILTPGNSGPFVLFFPTLLGVWQWKFSSTGWGHRIFDATRCKLTRISVSLMSSGWRSLERCGCLGAKSMESRHTGMS